MVHFSDQILIYLAIFLFGVFSIPRVIGNLGETCNCSCPKSPDICSFVNEMRERIKNISEFGSLLESRKERIIEATLNLLPSYIERKREAITKRIVEEKMEELKDYDREMCDDHDEKCFCESFVRGAPRVRNGMAAVIKIEYKDCPKHLVMKGQKTIMCEYGKLNHLPPICVCPSGTYGTDCQQKCNCAKGNSFCNEVTGVCEGGCLPGWTGSACDIVDPNPPENEATNAP